MDRKRADTMMSGAAVSIGLMDAGAKDVSYMKDDKEDDDGYDEDDPSRVPSFAAPVKSPQAP